MDLSFSEQVSAATESAFVQALVERGESAWTADPNVPNWSTIRAGSKVVLLGVNSTIVPYRPMLGTVATCPARSFFIQVAPVTWSELFALGWTWSLRLHHPFTWLECSSWATHYSPFPWPGCQAVATLASTLEKYLIIITFHLSQWKVDFAHRNNIKVSSIDILLLCTLLIWLWKEPGQGGLFEDYD